MDKSILLSLSIPNELECIVKQWVRDVLIEQVVTKVDETLLTTDEVCQEYHVSRVTLHNYRKSGKLLPFSKAGKQHTYKRCDCLKAFAHTLKMLEK